MKRFLLALSLCTTLLAGLSYFLFPSTQAAENPLLVLLDLPAPPPLNPQVPLDAENRPANFYDKSHPPGDDSPIEDLLDYWTTQSSAYTELGFNPAPSEKALDRLIAEVDKDNEKVYRFLNTFRGSKKAADLVKEIYDKSHAGNEEERNKRTVLKRWLTMNSPYFSSDLARDAAKAGDVNEYVDHQEELLALGRVDWERARPIVDRLYNSGGQVSRVLARWALYRNALDTNSLDDIERYRSELKSVVEDKTATAGMRDLAFDALVKEKEWDGRDEWYYTLLSDETLDDLQVGGRTYTGLTTIMYYSPAESYVEKMIELTKSDNKTVRTAAAKNLFQRLNPTNPNVIRALLPWLENPKWINGDPNGRSQLVYALQTTKIPESVPALIASLDEKMVVQASSNTMANANSMSRAMNSAVANITRSPANAAVYAHQNRTETVYPMRFAAVPAIAFQEDPRAVPALRRILNESAQTYEKSAIVLALFKCGGFSIPEQVEALEQVARESESLEVPSGMSNGVASISNMKGSLLPSLIMAREADTKVLLGAYIAAMSDTPSNDLARAVVDRIVELDRSDPKTSRTLRRIVTSWRGAVINSLLLRDLKNKRVETDAILKLLTVRKELRETQQADVYELRTGDAISLGISACLLEDANDYEAILNGPSDATKTAMLACARLIRAPLPVEKVATHVHSKDKLLALAAERYLESEDSPEARRVVLALHPNEAVILGATTAFYPAGQQVSINPLLSSLFATVSPYHARSWRQWYMGPYQQGVDADFEKRLREEVIKSPDLLGVYNWDENSIRIYKDKAVLSWEADPARYRERVLTTDEFERFKGLLSHFKADEQPPYLSCITDACKTKQLLMLGRNGGRRVFVKAVTMPPFFAELDRTFEEMRAQPSTIKYWASKDVPGLELLFANDDLDAIAVWKNGDDLRLLIGDKAKRVELDSAMEEFAENLPEDSDSPDAESDYDTDPRIAKERAKRAYEVYGWRSLVAGELGAVVAQPAEIGYIPPMDEFAVLPDRAAWKARAGAMEIRADEKGLYKIAAGKFTKIKTGYFEGPVVTPNGRWVVVTNYDDDRGGELVRVNLQTNKQFPIQSDDRPAYQAIAWVPSVGRVLVGPFQNEYEYSEDSRDRSANTSERYSFLDPETGRLTPATGDVRPLVQQTYRALQPASTPLDFWVAIPGEDETTIGIYNTRTLTIRSLLKLSRIGFDSMNMWVDEPAQKAYFVYEGHVLSVPIKIKG
ncbi:MAG: hypothetical protein DMF63_05985 [Acidobacteria bacterium]|nr:MAG: hypothetical protein DMF63_05985 [Acidobacteriota bacterium]